MPSITPSQRLAILLHGGILGPDGKTGLALLRYGEGTIVAVIDRDCAGQSLPQLTGIPREVPIVASVEAALAYGPDVLAIGIAPSGGNLPAFWWQELGGAIAAGLSIANGLHTPMATDLRLPSLVHPNQWIWDMRQEPPGLQVGGARARSLPCQRILTVGTDMAIGKMSTCLELDREARRRGLRSKFLATGQAGMMISGDGIPLDAIRVDFASGAVEQLVLHHGLDYDWLFVEGQGSLLNPASTATLPLIRGSQPTQLILAHRAGQTTIRKCPEVGIPPLPTVVAMYEAVANAGGAFGPVRVSGIALNTQGLTEAAAKEAIAQTSAETGLPCTDAVRFGAGLLLDALLDAPMSQET